MRPWLETMYSIGIIYTKGPRDESTRSLLNQLNREVELSIEAYREKTSVGSSSLIMNVCSFPECIMQLLFIFHVWPQFFYVILCDLYTGQVFITLRFFLGFCLCVWNIIKVF